MILDHRLSSRVTLDSLRVESSRRLMYERCRKYTPCGKVGDYLNLINNAVNPRDVYIFLLTAANNVGKTTLAVNLAQYLAVGTPNEFFDAIPNLRHFRRPNIGRIVTTATAAQEKYAEKEIPFWFPRGSYTSHRESHAYDVKFRFKRNSSHFDLFTFDQDPKQMESVDLDWMIVDEPMPYKLWLPAKARFRNGGLIFMVMTALYDSIWVARELETTDRLGKDVFKARVDAEDACRTHGIRGHMAHEYIVQMERDSDEDEATARLHGGYIAYSGRVYKQFDESFHVWDDLPAYHQECFDKGKYLLYKIVDPHDRKPFAIAWYAVFPNQDKVCIAEWPEGNFYKMKSSSVSIDEYRHIMIETEKQLGHIADINLEDPNFGNTPKLNGKTFKQLMAGPCDACSLSDKFLVECPHSIAFLDPPDSNALGISLVKQELGNPHKGIRPKLYFMRHCINSINSHKYWYYVENQKESKGLSEILADEFSDFCVLTKYGALSRWAYQEAPAPQVLRKPRQGRAT